MPSATLSSATFISKSTDIRSTPAIEFHSLSKTFNMTGWRIGFAVGQEDVINALRQVKDNYDSGVFNAIQSAAAVALDHYDHADIAGMRDEYHKRRDIAVNGLRAIGCHVTLRREVMYEFFDRLVATALPRIRDFRGVSRRAFDGRGNYTLGVTEHIIFPEIDIDKITKINGMDITFVTTAQTDEEAYALLKLLGIPFRNQNQTANQNQNAQASATA